MTQSLEANPGRAQSNLEARLQQIESVRRRIIDLSYRAKSAHLGSSLSCVEILDSIMNASGLAPDNATAPDRSRVVMSKGHAAMVLYATMESRGLIASGDLDRYLQDGTAYWGHVSRTPKAPAIDVSTGSLGHGLSLAVGYALGYRLRGWPARSFCVLSDGECDEGSTWEAALFAGHHRLGSVVAIVDYNKIQSLDRVSSVLELEPFADKWLSFGWSVSEVDGHDVAALDDAISDQDHGKPVVVLAHTVKGKGIKRIEDTVASHYHPARASDCDGVDNA